MTVYQNPDSFFNALEEAVDTAFSEFVQSTQGLLTSRAPVDTGRLASSFFISKAVPSDEVTYLPWAPKGAKKANLGPFSITMLTSSPWASSPWSQI